VELVAFDALPWKAWPAIVLAIALLTMMIANLLLPEVALCMGLTAMVVSQAITPSEALEGFASTGVTTFTVLSIDAGGIQQVSVVLPIFCRMFGNPNTLWVAQVYLMDPIARSSAFLNNTLVVALYIFAVQAWSGRWFPLSELLIRSAAIRRGTMTLLGSSTNLVVDGLAK
jgi:hypothetical protein